MTDQARISVNLTSGTVDIEAPVSALPQIFERLESFLPNFPSIPMSPAEAVINSPGADSGGDGHEFQNKKDSQVSLEKTDDTAKRSRGRQSSGKAESYSVVDLGLDQSARLEFKKFYESKSPKTQNDHLLVVIYWLLKNTSRTTVTSDEIFTGLRTVGERVPKRITSVVSNLSLLSYVAREGGATRLLHIGEDYVDRELPKTSSK